MTFTDCEDCENYEDTDECLGCVYYDDWVDNFVPISPEKKAAVANEKRANALIPKEEVSAEPSLEFMEKFKTAWKFVMIIH